MQFTMQILLRKSETRHDLQCTICNQGFRLYWERPSQAERETMRAIIAAELRRHHDAEHANDKTSAAHPSTPFNLPEWAGAPQFSGAALLGGLSGVHRTAPRTSHTR
jgi:hypothetical protein